MGCGVSSSEKRNWRDGDYQVGLNHAIVHVDGDQISLRFLKFLDSEDDAEHPMSWAVWGWAGLGCLVVTFRGKTTKAWISSDKNRIRGGIPELQPFDEMTWISAEEAALIRSRPKQSVAAPELPFPLNPGNPGKLLVLTGTPGAGKSTTAAAIAKLEQWVYYEGDGFIFGFNPYMSPNESQVDARSDKPALIGPGMALRWEAVKSGWLNDEELEAKKTTDRTPTIEFYRLMAEDIKKERERVGGNWVVANAISKRWERDIIREFLDDAVFVVLDISHDLAKERLSGREKDKGIADWCLAQHGKFEVAQVDEPRTVGFRILKESTEEQNARAILDLINKANA